MNLLIGNKMIIKNVLIRLEIKNELLPHNFCEPYEFGEVAISAITWAELLRGLHTHQTEQQFEALKKLLLILPFDIKASEKFGEVMRQKVVKANFDTLIASHALSKNLIIVTNNESDFKPFAENFDLKIENWVNN